jgi:hypothetical protein
MIDVGKHLNMGAPALANLLLGNGPFVGRSPVREKGCLFLCLVMGFRAVKHQATDVEYVLGLLQQHQCFAGNGLLWEKACRLLDVDTDIDLARLHHDIESGWPVVVGVDYKKGRKSSGHSDADHFVLCVGVDEDVLIVVDPSGGRLERIAVEGTTYNKGYERVPARLTELRFIRP